MIVPDSIRLDIEGRYCLTCLEGPVRKLVENDRLYSLCEKCGARNDRSLIIDNKVVWRLDADRWYWHESVGVVIVNQDKKILCLMRRIFPFANSLPAGHLDIGEKPEIAAIREMWEETGILAEGSLEHMGDFDIRGDSCQRGSDDHAWHLYRYVLPTKDVPLKLNDESTEARWLSLAEIQDPQNQITPAFAHIVERFKEGLVS